WCSRRRLQESRTDIPGDNEVFALSILVTFLFLSLSQPPSQQLMLFKLLLIDFAPGGILL
ncbi:hypothetical protein BgiMline_032354, partial [Biomphalaria glabrata]